MLDARLSRAVFLDINGVLNPFGSANGRILDAASVARVHRLAPIARIVLASSWPVAAAEDALGMSLEALDPDRRTEHGRPRAIWRWLQAHPEVTTWVSIDDDRIVDLLRRLPDDNPERGLLAWPERFIQTDWTWIDGFGPNGGTGLTQRVYERARSILTRPTEIERVRLAIARREVTLDRMSVAARGACCSTCFHGAKYEALVARQERAEAWLRKLEAKR